MSFDKPSLSKLQKEFLLQEKIEQLREFMKKNRKKDSHQKFSQNKKVSPILTPIS